MQVRPADSHDPAPDVGARAAGDDIASMPKIELHVHLEGTISAAVARQLAQRHGHDPAAELVLENGRYPQRYQDFMHFVDTFLATSRQIRTPDDLETVAAAFAAEQARQNIVYSEVTFTALTHVANGMPERDMWRALDSGLSAEGGITIGVIVDAVRELGPEAADRTITMIEDASANIVGLGLTGVEGSVHESAFVALRTAANRLGLGLTVHAGETGAPANVAAALDELDTDRIGHGVASIDDPELVVRLAREQVVLEVCPTSNVTLGLYPSLDAHPLPQLVSAGVAVTINSDDPPFFGTTLTDELRIAANVLGLDRAGLAQLQTRAIDASFAPAGIKRAVRRQIETWERNV
ncbi:MAG: adenosine deaminase [Nitriliruptoraceae bacterium]